MRIHSTTASAPGGDPMGLFDPMVGTMDVADTDALARFLSNSALLGQLSAKVPFNDPILNGPTATLGGGLITTFSISDRYGGPGADVHLVSSTELGSLFAVSIPTPNSATTKNNAQAVRDGGALFNDVFSGAIQALRDAGQPTDALKDFGCVMVPCRLRSQYLTRPTQTRYCRPKCGACLRFIGRFLFAASIA